MRVAALMRACLRPDFAHVSYDDVAGAALAGDTLSGTALMLLESDGALVCLHPQRHARHQAERAPTTKSQLTADSRQPSSISTEFQVRSVGCSPNHGPALCINRTAWRHHDIDAEH